MAPARVGLGGAGSSLRWLTRGDLLSQGLSGETPAALLADLDDPAWAVLASLAPSEDDLADERRPAASQRDYFLRRRALLRSLVGTYLSTPPGAVRISYDGHGAPRVVSTPSCFVSVSSRGSLAGLAVAAAPIGVDVELYGEPREPVWPVLHERERALLTRLPPDQRHAAFLRLWTMKEAYLKALGRGFERDPTEIEVRVVADGRARLRDGGASLPARVAEWRMCGAWIAACFVGL